jgi:hypothetical protein
MVILHCDSRCLRKCSKESPNRELALVITTYHLGPQTIVQNIIAHKMEGVVVLVTTTAHSKKERNNGVL